jgi:hypothetical protein
VPCASRSIAKPSRVVHPACVALLGLAVHHDIWGGATPAQREWEHEMSREALAQGDRHPQAPGQGDWRRTRRRRHHHEVNGLGSPRGGLKAVRLAAYGGSVTAGNCIRGHDDPPWRAVPRGHSLIHRSRQHVDAAFRLDLPRVEAGLRTRNGGRCRDDGARDPKRRRSRANTGTFVVAHELENLQGLQTQRGFKLSYR